MLKVLIIEDTKTVHHVLRRMFASVPAIDLVSVMNGAEGLEMLQHRQDFDVILLDWEMPILNGPETLKEIVKTGLTVPVVMMTTKNSPDDIIKMLEAGASEYMMKPFTGDILFEKIASVTGKSLPHVA